VYKMRYLIKEIEETTTWTYDKDGDGIPDTTYDEGVPSPGDIQDAIKAMQSDSWDSLDIRADEVICYPADGSINYRTGAESRTTVVIKGSENAIERLVSHYFHIVKERKRRDNERRASNRSV
jgi:hypothetical protein